MVQLRVVRGDGGRVDYERRLRVGETVGDEVDVVVEMDGGAFINQVAGEG